MGMGMVPAPIYRLDEAHALLGRTPRVLAELLYDLPSAWVMATEGPDTWSPHEVLAHLCQAERDLWIPRTHQILEGRPFVDFNRVGHRDTYAGASMAQLLDEFRTLRAESLVTLAALAPTEAMLETEGRHPDFGPVKLRELLSTWVAHDLTHTAQIIRCMGKRYRDDVGPWRKYLRIVQ